MYSELSVFQNFFKNNLNIHATIRYDDMGSPHLSGVSVALANTPPRTSMKPQTRQNLVPFIRTPPRKGRTLTSLDTLLKNIGSVDKNDNDVVDDIASSPLPASIGGISRALKKPPLCKTTKKHGSTKRRCRASDVFDFLDSLESK